jgi:hypothetical protein
MSMSAKVMKTVAVNFRQVSSLIIEPSFYPGAATWHS